MHPRRFFLSSLQENQVALNGEEAHHLIHVLRTRIGDTVEVMDGSGKVWKGRVAQIHTDSVIVSELDLLLLDIEPSGALVLIQSVCRADKLEWILQKTTELGVSEIRLLNAERCVVKIPEDKVQNRLERWQKIIVGAAKQSRRSTLPKVHAPAGCKEVFQSIQADLSLLFCESENQMKLKNLLRNYHWKSIAFCVGPEGGWTEREHETFVEKRFQPVSLGPNVLRTETAAIAALAVLKYEMEDR